MNVVSREDRLPFVTAHMATYIRVRRHELGLSLDQLAERCGSSKSHIWALERRQSKNPTLWLILSLCDGLQCSLNSLIGADVSQPMYSEQEMALVDAHRRIFLVGGPTHNPGIPNGKSPPPQTNVEPYAWTWKYPDDDEVHRRFARHHPGFAADSPYEIVALYSAPPATGSGDIIAAFEAAHPDLYWHIAKGRIRAGEPLYGALISTMAGSEIGFGESDVSADDAFRIAVEDAGLTLAASEGSTDE